MGKVFGNDLPGYNANKWVCKVYSVITVDFKQGAH